MPSRHDPEGSPSPAADALPDTGPRLSPLLEGRDERQVRALEPWGGERAANVFATLVRHTDLFEVWSPFAYKLLMDSALTPRLRELVILRVSWRIASSYEWGHHVRLARRAGLADEEIEALATPDPKLDSAFERTLAAATDELLADDEISAATWSGLGPELTAEQRVELVFLVGGYRMLASALRTLGVAAERPLPPLGHSSVPADSM
ncbi:carboxymuconolactone decarboxylase family protein [Streptomyces sp. NPDC051985]|uniref:carboxymuconolactone decarboxylase family protein n=1 Tax=Streptomyces sp. NPDC051985 TaxID=3155807 RepID=UPI0034394B56